MSRIFHKPHQSLDSFKPRVFRDHGASWPGGALALVSAFGYPPGLGPMQFVPLKGGFAITNHDCCSNRPLMGPLAMQKYGIFIAQKQVLNDRNICTNLCNVTQNCNFAAFSKRNKKCNLCATCDFSRPSYDAQRKTFTTYARPNFFTTAAPTSSHIQTLVDMLQTDYSISMYGAPGRIPPTSEIRIIWLQELPTAAVDFLIRIGACGRSAALPHIPFFRNIFNYASPTGSIWIHQYSRAIPNNSWVEVMHGNVSIDRRKESWKIGGMWSYVAPGSGVSINVGRSIVLPYGDAANLLARIFCIGSRCSNPAKRCDPSVRWKGPLKHDWRIARGKGGVATALPFRLNYFAHSWLDDIDFQTLDTIQIVEHYEYFSDEARHEIIDLRYPECKVLTHDMPELRCGREPYLFKCNPDSPALRRLHGHGNSRSDLGPTLYRVRQKIARSHEFCNGQRDKAVSSSPPCYIGSDTSVYCGSNVGVDTIG